MPKCLVFTAVLLSLAIPTSAQDLRGFWSGTLHIDTDHHVVLDVEDDSSGRLAAVLYEDERSADIPVDMLNIVGTHLTLGSSMFDISLDAKASKDGRQLSGIWKGKQSAKLQLTRTTEKAAWPNDTSPHKQLHLTLPSGVTLEVLDWGGEGPPVLLLAGLGNNAHTFDTFATKLTKQFHVYGITRRGFGSSSWPAAADENYTASKLGEDVLFSIATLHLMRPLLIGHSIAGEELSYVGTHAPEKVRGLVYLDAAYSYAYYDEDHPSFELLLDDVRRKLNSIRFAVPPRQHISVMQQLVEVDLPLLRNVMKSQVERLKALPTLPTPLSAAPPPTAGEAVLDGQEKFKAPQGPVLAIFAVEGDQQQTSDFADRFAKGAPRAHVIQLHHASHFVFKSHEDEVLNEIASFSASLH